MKTVEDLDFLRKNIIRAYKDDQSSSVGSPYSSPSVFAHAVQEIQLDAIKHGITLAANAVKVRHEYTEKCPCSYCTLIRMRDNFKL